MTRAAPGPGTRALPLVIFDMDGVLLHLDLDLSTLRTAIERAFAEEGLERSCWPILETIDETCTELASHDPERAERLHRQAWQIVDDEELRAARRCQPAAGLAALLHSLAGVPMALFTNNSRAAVEAALRTAGVPQGMFLGMRCREGAQSIKPSGEPVVELVEASAALYGGALPERVFVVGDSAGDMESAVDAQARLAARGWTGTVVPVGVRRPSRLMRDIEEAGAWFYASDLAEVGRLVEQRPIAASLSVVLLAYNEVATIAQAIVDVRRFCKLYTSGYQIVVVDDGSSDGTSAAAERASEGDVTLVRHEVNQGMGAGMRDGYLAATMDYVTPLPADRQVRAQSLIAHLPHIAPDRVVVSQYVAPPSGEARKWLSRAFRLLVRTVGGLRIDFAGTYVFHRKWLSVIELRRLVSDTFLFSFELLHRLEQAGCTFVEVQIEGYPREVGKSRELALDRMARVFGEIVRYRARSLRAGWLQRARP